MKITFIKTGKRVKKNEKDNKINTIISNIFEESQKENKNLKKVKNQKNIQTKSKEKIENKKSGGSKINLDKFFETIKPIFRKNQLVLLTLALMLVTAGYMNYNNAKNELELAELGDARLVSTNVVENEIETGEIINNEENKLQEENQNEVKVEENKEETKNAVNETNAEVIETTSNEIKENEVNTNSNVQKTDTNYFTQTRLERETMYSQMLEAYQKILENESIPADQKSIASNEIKNINDRKNAISIVENLIKTKGFEDAVLLINDNNVNVMVKSKENLKTEQVAQITNIVSRELKAEIENIHISTHN